MNNESIVFIAEHYGFDNQKEQLNEEMAELTLALSKYKREFAFHGELNCFTEYNRLQVAEEIADVIVMLEQIKHLLAIPDDYIEKQIEYKVNRQLARIEQETEKEKE